MLPLKAAKQAAITRIDHRPILRLIEQQILLLCPARRQVHWANSCKISGLT